MKKLLIWTPILCLTMTSMHWTAIIAKELENSPNRSEALEWLAAIAYSFGIHSAMFVLLAHGRKRIVRIYSWIQFVIYSLFFLRRTNLSFIVNHFQIWTFIEGIYLPVSFAAIASVVLYLLAQKAMDSIQISE